MKPLEKLIIKNFLNAENIQNFRIMPNGTLKKREGYTRLIDLGNPIRGAISQKGASGEIIYAVAGSTLYKISGGENYTATALGTLSSSSFRSDTQRVLMFMFNDILYILGGGNYYKYTSAGIYIVEGYVPLIRRNATPTSIGTVYERKNLLNSKARMRFIPNVNTYFYKLYGDVVSIDKVLVNGNPYSSTATLVREGSTCYIRLDISVQTSSEDILEVWFTLNEDSRRSEVLSCTDSAVFGGDSDSRVFLYGGERQSVLYPSEPEMNGSSYLISAEYFPAGGEMIVDNGNFPLTGAMRYGDRLFIYTSDTTYYTYAREGTATTGRPSFTYPIIPWSFEVGSVGQGCVGIIDNEPHVLSSGGLYRFIKPENSNELMAHSVSIPDYIGMTKDFISNCSMYVSKNTGEIWFYGKGSHAGRIAVYDKRRSLWFSFTNISPSFMFTYSNEPAFVSGSAIYLLSSDATSDVGDGFEAIYESSFLDLGNAFENKTVYEFAMSLGRAVGSKVNCELISDKGDSHSIELEIPEDIPHDDTPSVLRAHARLGHVSFVAFKLISPADSEKCLIHEIMIRYRVN